MNEPKVGDRVRVEFEGVVKSPHCPEPWCKVGDWLLLPGEKTIVRVVCVKWDGKQWLASSESKIQWAQSESVRVVEIKEAQNG